MSRDDLWVFVVTIALLAILAVPVLDWCGVIQLGAK